MSKLRKGVQVRAHRLVVPSDLFWFLPMLDDPVHNMELGPHLIANNPSVAEASCGWCKLPVTDGIIHLSTIANTPSLLCHL